MKTERMSIPQKETFNYPLKVKHIFLTFLQEFCSFQNPRAPMYFNPEDPSASNIWILDSFGHDIENKIGVKPCIVFSRGPLYVAQGFLTDNLLRQTSRTVMRGDPPRPYNQPIEYRSFMFSGQVDWKCCSRQGMEAESIAAIVAMLHQAYKQQLREKGLHDIKSIQVGEEMLVEGDVETEFVMVPVSVSFDLQAHYEFWEDGDQFNHAYIKGGVDSKKPDGTNVPGDLLLNTDP